jgi:hypothetical protein
VLLANRRNLKLNDYGISSKRYKELCGFCEQYPEWVDELKYKTDILKSKEITDMPMAPSRIGNSQEDLAIKRTELQSKCEIIEQTAIEADADLYQYIIKNVCYEKPIWYLIDIMNMPCSERAFRDKKRYFFFLLSMNKKM